METHQVKPKKSVRLQLSSPVLKQAGDHCYANSMTLSHLVEKALKQYIRQTSQAGTHHVKYGD